MHVGGCGRIDCAIRRADVLERSSKLEREACARVHLPQQDRMTLGVSHGSHVALSTPQIKYLKWMHQFLGSGSYCLMLCSLN
jgi:hypothetical protein